MHEKNMEDLEREGLKGDPEGLEPRFLMIFVLLRVVPQCIRSTATALQQYGIHTVHNLESKRFTSLWKSKHLVGMKKGFRKFYKENTSLIKSHKRGIGKNA